MTGSVPIVNGDAETLGVMSGSDVVRSFPIDSLNVHFYYHCCGSPSDQPFLEYEIIFDWPRKIVEYFPQTIVTLGCNHFI